MVCGPGFTRRACPLQRARAWKRSTDPDVEAKKNRVLALYGVADGIAEPDPDDPTVVILPR